MSKTKTRASGNDPIGCPKCCGKQHPLRAMRVTRGPVTVGYDPLVVEWRGRTVPLSRTEAYLFGYVALKGRASYTEIETALATIGVSPQRRRKALFLIRRKFRELGACDPFAPLHQIGVRMADAYGA